MYYIRPRGAWCKRVAVVSKTTKLMGTCGIFDLKISLSSQKPNVCGGGGGVASLLVDIHYFMEIGR